MSVEATSPDILGAGNGPQPYSRAWWQERSGDELREIMSHGFELGPAFDAAMAEAERRACERLKAEEQAALQRASRIRRIRLIGLTGLSLTCVLVLIAIETIG